MYHLTAALALRLREFRLPANQDRGETGPIGYAFMVSAIVLLAIFVAGWGRDVAEFFMSQVQGVSVDGGGGDGGGGE